MYTGSVTSTISAQSRYKVFLKQQHQHQQWKNMGAAKLKLYHQNPTNVKQLVIEADTKEKTMLISTIVLSDGVDRVGKAGVAIELTDFGARTGIGYMVQLRNETSASGLFDSLLAEAIGLSQWRSNKDDAPSLSVVGSGFSPAPHHPFCFVLFILFIFIDVRDR